MDKFIPAEWESSDDDADETDTETMSWGDHYSDYLTCGAQLLRHRMDRDSELIQRLTAAAARGPGEPFGPLSEDDAELVVLLACNGPWHRRTSSEVVHGKRFRSPRPAVQVWDPRYRDWRLASSVFPHATWGIGLHQGGVYYASKNLREVGHLHCSIRDDNPVAWELASGGDVPPTDRFLLDVRGLSNSVFGESLTMAELVWLRHTGMFDSRVWVYFVENADTDWFSAEEDGPPSEGWMLIDDAIAEHRARRTLSTGSQQQRSGGVHAMTPPGQGAGTSPAAAASQMHAHQSVAAAASLAASHARVPPVHPPAASVPIVQQAPSTGQQIMTTAAGVAVAAAGIRAAGAIGDRVSQWAQANNAPEVMGSFDATGDGAADFALLDTNMNGIADGADTVVLGDAAQGAVEASNSVIDTIAEWFS